MNIKRWLLCGFLFLICFLILHWLNNTNSKIVESYGRNRRFFRGDSNDSYYENNLF